MVGGVGRLRGGACFSISEFPAVIFSLISFLSPGATWNVPVLPSPTSIHSTSLAAGRWPALF